MEERIKELENKMESLTKFAFDLHKTQGGFNEQLLIHLDELSNGDNILKDELVKALEIIGRLEAEVAELKKNR